uniref:Phosphodiesterase I n=1 Tax=Parastrongyloides trichosuri TaxID=131310 RepID=A0A0N5A3V0_PARTI
MEVKIEDRFKEIFFLLKEDKRDCTNASLLNTYDLIEFVFSSYLNKGSCSDFEEWIDMTKNFLSMPEDARLLVIKFLFMKPVGHPGRELTQSELSLINNDTCNITKFINEIPKEDITFDFIALNTNEAERIEYCRLLTGSRLIHCSIGKLVEIKKNEYISLPNFELLKNKQLEKYTDVAMVYFTLCNTSNIYFENDPCVVKLLDQITKEYHRLEEINAFDEFDKMNFQNSLQIMLIKCMILLAKTYDGMGESKIVMELYDSIIKLKYFEKLPSFIQCQIVLTYCNFLRKYNKQPKMVTLVKKQMIKMKELPYYFKAKLYDIKTELVSGLEQINYNGFSFPVLEGTIDWNDFKDDNNFKRITNHKDRTCYILKKYTKCKYGSIFNRYLWVEVCLMLIFNNMNIEQIKSLFYSEHYSQFTKKKLKELLYRSCSMLLKLKSRKTLEIMDENRKSYMKFVNTMNNTKMNFENNQDYILFVSCFDVKDMIKLIHYVLNEPYKEINQEWIYLWDNEKKKCFVGMLNMDQGISDLALKQRAGFHVLKKLLQVQPCCFVEV